jgi:hypothetical protein
MLVRLGDLTGLSSRVVVSDVSVEIIVTGALSIGSFTSAHDSIVVIEVVVVVAVDSGAVHRLFIPRCGHVE